MSRYEVNVDERKGENRERYSESRIREEQRRQVKCYSTNNRTKGHRSPYSRSLTAEEDRSQCDKKKGINQTAGRHNDDDKTGEKRAI